MDSAVKQVPMDIKGSVPSVTRTVRWSLRRESLPLATIRRAISPDNLLWRRR